MSSSSKVDALRETLAAQGVDATRAPEETLGRREGRLSGLPSLPPARIVRAGLEEAEEGDAAAGDFRIRDTLGEGGMGVVLLAEQRMPPREVAIKRLRAGDGHLVDTLLREATLTGQLEHPNIVPVHAVVSDEEGPAVVMKRITGREWQALFEAGDTPFERHLEILLQVCNALAFAHDRGVIHRDVKPENVMIGAYGEVYLLDWGIARRVDEPPTDRIAGTPCFLAPEMLEGRADARSDVFLLGATLHQILTGEARHGEGDLIDVLLRAKDAEPHLYDEGVPDELARICNRACAKRPEDRYPDVAAFREALLRYRSHQSAAALTATAEERLEELRALTRRASQPGEDEEASRLAYLEAQRLFNEARFGFEQSLAAWPEGRVAQDGLEECLATMARYELGRGQPDAAQAALEAMEAPPAALLAEVEAQRAEREAARARFAQLEHDRDRHVGARERSRALTFLGVAVVLLTAGFVALRVAYPDYAPPTLRFAIVGVAVFGAMLAIVAWWRRRGAWNLVNRRIAQIALLTLGVSALNRFASLAAGADGPRILLTDALLIGMGGLALTPFHQGGPWLASMAFALAFVGAFRPAWIEPGFIAFAIAVPIFLLAWRRWGPGPRREHGTDDAG